MSFWATNPGSFLGKLWGFVIYLTPAKPKACDGSQKDCDKLRAKVLTAHADPHTLTPVTCPSHKDCLT